MPDMNPNMQMLMDYLASPAGQAYLVEQQKTWAPMLSGKAVPGLPNGVTAGDFSQAPGHAAWGAQMSRMTPNYSDALKNISNELNLSQFKDVNQYQQGLISDFLKYGPFK